MHENIVVNPQEAPLLYRMRPIIAASYIKLRPGRLCDVRPGVVVQKKWSLHIEQSTAHTSELLVHFVDLLGVLPRRNRFTRLKKTAIDDTG